MLDVQDKVVAITGAARGLGQEFAWSLAAAGARIVAGDINDCSETLGLVKNVGPDAVGVKLDVTDPGSAASMVEAGMRAFGRLDALRSEERRVGKECRSGGAAEHEKKREAEVIQAEPMRTAMRGPAN